MHAYPRWLPESLNLCEPVRCGGTVLVYRAPARAAAAEHAPGAAAGGFLGVLVRDHDVQFAAARRHHRPRCGHGYFYNRAGAVGIDAGSLSGAIDSGAVLWRW